MQNSTRLPASGGKNTKNTRPQTPAKWTLLNLLTTWFLTDAGKAVVVDPAAPFGASNDEWRELLRRTPVQIPQADIEAHWGQMARRDFLNWCEEALAEEQRPKLFTSREEAQDFHEKISKDFDSSKRNEISELDKAAREADGGQSA